MESSSIFFAGESDVRCHILCVTYVMSFSGNFIYRLLVYNIYNVDEYSYVRMYLCIM